MVAAQNKPCKRCNEDRFLTEFSPSKRHPDGRLPVCKPCHAKRMRERRAANPDYENEKARKRYAANKEERARYLREWRAANPDKAQAQRDAYYSRVKGTPEYREMIRAKTERHKDKITAYRRANRDRWNEWGKAWRKRNPEKVKAIWAAHRHKRKAATKDGPTAAEILEWAKSVKRACYWCGVKLTLRTYTLDHYQPLSRGGEHAVHNFVMACSRCNCRKNARDPLEFAKEVGKLL
jgi:5-methylcytosine-specific restriction endonuclease McrA